MTENTQKIALVTGAAGGLGSYITRRLHADGHKVVVTGLTSDKLEALAGSLSPDGSTAMPLPFTMAFLMAKMLLILSADSRGSSAGRPASSSQLRSFR